MYLYTYMYYLLGVKSSIPVSFRLPLLLGPQIRYILGDKRIGLKDSLHEGLFGTELGLFLKCPGYSIF